MCYSLDQLPATELTRQLSDEEKPSLFDDAHITPTMTQCDVTVIAIITSASGGDIILTEFCESQSEEAARRDVTHVSYSLT